VTAQRNELKSKSNGGRFSRKFVKIFQEICNFHQVRQGHKVVPGLGAANLLLLLLLLPVSEFLLAFWQIFNKFLNKFWTNFGQFFHNLLTTIWQIFDNFSIFFCYFFLKIFVFSFWLNFQNYTKLSNNTKFVQFWRMFKLCLIFSLPCCNWSPNYSVLVFVWIVKKIAKLLF
jgi:hypothetical protein